MPVARSHARLMRTLYFLLFIGVGSCAPFTSLFLKRTLIDSHGKSAIDLIGLIYAVLPFIGMIAATIASLLADRLRIGRRIIAINCLAVAIMNILVAQAGERWLAGWPLQERFLYVFACMSLLALAVGPINGLLDAEILHFLNKHSRRGKYGTFRLWGTYGWSVSTIGAGAILAITQHLTLMFYTAALGYLLLGVVAWRGVSRDPVERPAKIPLEHLRRNRPFLMFLVFALLYGMIFNACYTYVGYFFDDVMHSFWEIGLIFGLWTLFEIPVMIYSDQLLARFGNRRLIMAGLAFNALRLVLLSTFTMSTPFVWKIVISLLQGPGFALTHLGFIDTIDRFAHHDLRATYLNTANVVQNTFGASIGGLVGSWIIHGSGSAALFRMSGYGLIVLLIFYALVVKPRSEEEYNTHKEPGRH
jgi:PPP family 3-phenylpropionic acid transporter